MIKQRIELKKAEMKFNFMMTAKSFKLKKSHKIFLRSCFITLSLVFNC